MAAPCRTDSSRSAPIRPRPGGRRMPSDRAAIPAVVPSPTPAERQSESSWYYRLESFYWNERSGGVDFVNEAGPISTLGYLHRFGQERVRFELFGGTVSYDGAAMFTDDNGNSYNEPYHQSFGTNYLGVRAEYDLLIEPAAWTRARLLLGVGTRFWIRDLRDAVTLPGLRWTGIRKPGGPSILISDWRPKSRTNRA